MCAVNFQSQEVNRNFDNEELHFIYCFLCCDVPSIGWRNARFRLVYLLPYFLYPLKTPGNALDRLKGFNNFRLSCRYLQCARTFRNFLAVLFFVSFGHEGISVNGYKERERPNKRWMDSVKDDIIMKSVSVNWQLTEMNGRKSHAALTPDKKWGYKNHDSFLL